MKAAIHQPQYLPYPGFFHKLTLVDIFVVMDDTQFDKRFTNRNRILDPHGIVWLTVPINKAQRFSPNRAVEINNGIPWRGDHWKKISTSYGKASHFSSYRELEDVYAKEWASLLELNMELLKRTMRWLEIRVPVVKESELGVGGQSTERLVNICKAVNADTYVSGIGGKKYIEEEIFRRNGVKLEYQNYTQEPYPQRFTKDFVPNLSIIDMLANVGPESADLIKGIANRPVSAGA